MLYNYIKLAFRHMRRDRVYSAINIFGLAVGLAVAMLIMLYVNFELSFDKFYENGDRIYRITDVNRVPRAETWTAIMPIVVGSDIEESITGIDAVTRFVQHLDVRIIPREDLGLEELRIQDRRMYLTDPAALRIFNYEFILGNAESALDEPFSVIITESSAKEYFGDSNPIGRQIITKRSDGTLTRTVTGVIRDIPRNSTIQFDCLGTISPGDIPPAGMWIWGRSSAEVYLLLADGNVPAELADAIKPLMEPHFYKTDMQKYKLRLEPLYDIHLKSEAFGWAQNGGDTGMIYLLLSIGALVLTLVVINYSNLAIARSLSRNREIAVRKVVGAHKHQLILQFMAESSTYAVSALIAAWILVELALPKFNAFLGRELVLNMIGDSGQLVASLSLALVLGLICGAYPAYVQSRRMPVDAFYNRGVGPQGQRSRRVMVVFQFVVSTVLMLSAFIIYKQLGFIRTTRLNVGEDQIVYVFDNRPKMNKNYDALKLELLRQRSISNVTRGSLPGGENYSGSYLDDQNGEQVLFNSVVTDVDYMETFGLELIAGRGFLAGDYEQMKAFFKDNVRDITIPVIVNEATVAMLELDDPLGYEIPDKRMIIIGIIKDFHLKPFRDAVEPFGLQANSTLTGDPLIVRLKAGHITDGLAVIRSAWQQFELGPEPTIHFLGERMDRAYLSDIKLGQIFGWFAGLAILIACLGLFGLAAFTAERRTKEIGIRKVVGASVGDIVTLLGREFVALVIIANLIAWPLAWYGVSRWLQNFAYHLDLTLLPFVLVGLAVTGIALATVTFQARKAATANPVEALRYE